MMKSVHVLFCIFVSILMLRSFIEAIKIESRQIEQQVAIKKGKMISSSNISNREKEKERGRKRGRERERARNNHSQNEHNYHDIKDNNKNYSNNVHVTT